MGGTALAYPAAPELGSPPPSSYYPPSGKLGFGEKLRVGWQLTKTCWSVLRQELSLLVAPLVTLVIGVALVTGYALAVGGFAKLVAGNRYEVTIRLFPLVALVTAISVVGQAVVVAGATNIMQGHRAPLAAAWAVTVRQLPRLIMFGVIFAAERSLASLLRSRRRFSVGGLAANVIDRAWDFATFLAIPVILYENRPALASVKRSAELVGKRWGTQLTSRALMNLTVGVLAIPVIVVGVVLAGISPLLGGAVLVISFVAIVVTAATLTGVLSAALYRFGVTGLVSPGFTEADMWAAFARRS